MATTHLATTTDKLGNTIDILHTDKIGMSPIFTFFLRHMAELIDNKFAFPMTTWSDDDSAVYAVQGDKILGHIVYSKGGLSGSENVLYITLGAIDPECRGRGIYTILHHYLEDTGKKLGCSAITSHIHKNNTAALKSAENLGKRTLFNYVFKRLT
jgi:ribosomal protein S18 acetylase RimI-like enzyme